MSAVPASTADAAAAGGDTEEEKAKKQKAKEAKKGSAVEQNVYLAQGHNGQALVEAAMDRLGWTKTTDKTAENWKLRWTETKGMVNYGSFKEGQQLVNHIPNCELICNKLGLLISLREHERIAVSMKSRPPQLQLADFFPETYVLDYPREREAFFEAFKPGEIWINKPTGLNQGKGIFLVRDPLQFREELRQKEETRAAANPVKAGKSMGRIVQRYIMNPLLINGRKFDIRTYLLIGSTAPFLVLFHHGYLRLSIHRYDADDANLCTHLTNQYIQKKDEKYSEVKDDTVWSMDQLNDYLNSLRQPRPDSDGAAQAGPPEENWVFGGLERQMKAILMHMFGAVKHKLTARLGYFELYGIDFMVDDNYKVFLIEVNTNPAMHVNCKLLNDILPPLIERTIHIALECFEKSKRRRSLLPLKSAGGFQVLHCGATPAASPVKPQRRALSPQRTTSNSRQQQQQQSPSKPASGGGGGGASQARTSAAPANPQPLRRQATSPNVLPAAAAAAARRKPKEEGRNSLRKSQPAQQQQQQPEERPLSWKPSSGSGSTNSRQQPELISSSPGVLLLSYQRVRTPAATRREAASATDGDSKGDKMKPQRRPLADRSS